MEVISAEEEQQFWLEMARRLDETVEVPSGLDLSFVQSLLDLDGESLLSDIDYLSPPAVDANDHSSPYSSSDYDHAEYDDELEHGQEEEEEGGRQLAPPEQVPEPLQRKSRKRRADELGNGDRTSTSAKRRRINKAQESRGWPRGYGAVWQALSQYRGEGRASNLSNDLSRSFERLCRTLHSLEWRVQPPPNMLVCGISRLVRDLTPILALLRRELICLRVCECRRCSVRAAGSTFCVRGMACSTSRATTTTLQSSLSPSSGSSSHPRCSCVCSSTRRQLSRRPAMASPRFRRRAPSSGRR